MPSLRRLRPRPGARWQARRSQCGDARSRVRAGPTREELVAVGPRQSFDALVLENAIEQPARTAVCIRDEDLVEAVRSTAPDPIANRGGDPAGSVVEIRRQAGDLDVRQVGGQGDEHAAQGATANDEYARWRDLRLRHVARR